MTKKNKEVEVVVSQQEDATMDRKVSKAMKISKVVILRTLREELRETQAAADVAYTKLLAVKQANTNGVCKGARRAATGNSIIKQLYAVSGKMAQNAGREIGDIICSVTQVGIRGDSDMSVAIFQKSGYAKLPVRMVQLLSPMVSHFHPSIHEWAKGKKVPVCIHTPNGVYTSGNSSFCSFYDMMALPPEATQLLKEVIEAEAEYIKLYNNAVSLYDKISNIKEVVDELEASLLINDLKSSTEGADVLKLTDGVIESYLRKGTSGLALLTCETK